MTPPPKPADARPTRPETPASKSGEHQHDEPTPDTLPDGQSPYAGDT